MACSKLSREIGVVYILHKILQEYVSLKQKLNRTSDEELDSK